jgi:hypothetical protein
MIADASPEFRRQIARRFNDALSSKASVRRKSSVCYCMRKSICHTCKRSMNSDARCGDVRRGSDGRLHNVCASCLD